VSNHLAIATVTGTLQRTLTKAVATVTAGAATVSTKRPDGAAPAPGPGIHIFLYQVMPNAAYRNADLPVRRPGGEIVQRPQAALSLHYLLSFTGDDTKLEPQCLLGAVVRHLHARPLLAHDDIRDTITTAPLAGVLAKSTLGDQSEHVRFTPLNLSLEELSKVWSVFFQTPYLLSVAYEASVVLIESDDTPHPALPVTSRNVYVVPLQQPVIDRIVSAAGDREAIVSTSTLRIVGQRLHGTTTRVLLDGNERVPDEVRDGEVRVAIPGGTEAGVHAVQIAHQQVMGAASGTPHRGFESNVGTFVLRPQVTITKVTHEAVAALRVKFDLPIGGAQRVTLVLNGTTGTPPTVFAQSDPIRDADPTVVIFKIPAVTPGTYFVTVQVDGAANVLDLEPSSPTFGPTVSLP
jgi:hypothetical protein